MMFLVHWEPVAFNRMQGLITDNPDLQTEFTYSIRALITKLSRHADTWGESRNGPYRLGHEGVLQALVRVDEEDESVEIVDVQLNRRSPPG